MVSLENKQLKKEKNVMNTNRRIYAIVRPK